MKIFAYRRPTTAQVSCTDFTITISPFEGAAQATWDDIDPEKADYIMVPFTFKACVPGLDAQRWYLG